jgi:predicted neuraminidase
MNRLLFFILILLSQTVLSQENSLVTRGYLYEKAPFIECHASTLAYTPKGLVAAWFGGTKEANKDVEIWFSTYKNNVWTTPVSVANGIQHASKRYPCWNPVLYQVPKGELMLFYKVGPSPQEWWGELITSKDNGKTWSEPRRLPEDILGPVKNKPVLLSDGTLFCPVSTEVTSETGWRMHFELTKDLGKTWEIIGPIDPASNYNVIQQSVLFHGGNKLQLLARSKDNYVMTSWSENNGRSWSALEKTSLPNPNSGTDAVTLKNGLQVLIYNHSSKPEGKWSGKRTPLNVAISKDGINWKSIFTLEDQPGEYSYPSVIQGNDGLVYISYTWKRRKISYVVLDPSKFEKL